MSRNSVYPGFLSILNSVEHNPLQIWEKKVWNGHIISIMDNDIQSLVLEVKGLIVSTTYITCPANPNRTLGIKLPYFIMKIKYLNRFFFRGAGIGR